MAEASRGRSGFRPEPRSGRIRFLLYRRSPACDRREPTCNGDLRFWERSRWPFPAPIVPLEVAPGECRLSPTVRALGTRAELPQSPGEDRKRLPHCDFRPGEDRRNQYTVRRPLGWLPTASRWLAGTPLPLLPCGQARHFSSRCFAGEAPAPRTCTPSNCVSSLASL